MTLRILVIDDELGRIASKREDFLRRWQLQPAQRFQQALAFEFITSQHVRDGSIENDAMLAVDYVSANPSAWALVLLDMQFDYGELVGDVALSADPQFGLTIQAALEQAFPTLPIVQFTAQSQSNLKRQNDCYLSKLDGKPDDLRLVLVEHGAVSLRDKARLLCVPEDTVVASQATVELYTRVFRLAKTDAHLLILGETGTGKEHLGRYAHSVAKRSSGPWVPIQVSSLAPTLFESELFGHDKGAFTGADKANVGTIGRAAGGTLFMDEVGALPPEQQAKLLRMLSDRRYRRVGSNIDQAVECGIVAATQDNLQQIGFRADLLARFSQVTLPALRERPEELLLLAAHFLKTTQTKNAKRGIVFSAAASQALAGANFADNARGLERAVVSAVLSLSSNSVVQPRHLGLPPPQSPEPGQPAADPAVQPATSRVGATSAPSATDEAKQVAPPLSQAAGMGPSFGAAVAQLARAAMPASFSELRGALAQLASTTDLVNQNLAIAALKACRHPSGKVKVLPALQLLLGDPALTATQSKRKLNELLGLKQQVVITEALLLQLCDGDPAEVLAKLHQQFSL